MSSTCDDEKFDFIIVGAGTAGCAEAYLLARAGYLVGLFEAGPNLNDDPLIVQPQNAFQLSDPGNINRFFLMDGHSSNRNAGSKSFPLVGGRLLGGSSSVNGMQFVRSTDAFYREWQALAAGDPTWGPENASKIFKALETFYGVPGFYDPRAHGERGKLAVAQTVKSLEGAKRFTEAVCQLGFPIIRDFNAPDGDIGAFVYWQLTQQPQGTTNTRENSDRAFIGPLTPVPGQQNAFTAYDGKINLFLRSTVLKIEFSKKCQEGDRQARGIRVLVDGEEKRVRCRHEVILAAGVTSPLLLQLSGVGPSQVLSDAHIKPVIINELVGRGGYNHPLVFLALNPSPPPCGPCDRNNNHSTNSPASQNDYAIYSGGCFLPRPPSRCGASSSSSSSSSHERFYQILLSGDWPSSPSIGGVLLKADSESRIHVQSSDPLQVPLYDFNYFTTEHDLQQGFELYSYMWKIARNMGLSINTTLCPDPEVPANREAIMRYITTSYAQAYHYVRWLRMGDSPCNSVVSPDGLIWGLSNVRCIDNQIVPVNPVGNTQATAYFAAFANYQKIIAKLGTACR